MKPMKPGAVLAVSVLLAAFAGGCEQQAMMPDTTHKQKNIAPLDAFAQAKHLGKGVNLGNALEAPKEGEWGVTLQESYFKIIRDGGFDTVRVPIKWSAHASMEAPYTVDSAFFSRIDWVVDHALAQNLNVVINIHHYDEMYKDAERHKQRFIGLWRQIAGRYKDKPDNVYLELLNEPTDKLSADIWNGIVADTVKEVRAVDPRHTLIVGGVNWNSIQALATLQLPADEKNMIGTFHFYDPILFTHQGAEWMTGEYGTTGVAWPGPPKTPVEPVSAASKVNWVSSWLGNYNKKPYDTNPAGPAPLVEQLNTAEEWSKKNGRPLWVGEFGAYNKADMQSRVNWTTFVRTEFEKRGFSWSYWEFCAGFGVFNKDAYSWNQSLKDALIAKP